MCFQGCCTDLRPVPVHLLYNVQAGIVIMCSYCIVVCRIHLDAKVLGLSLDREGTGLSVQMKLIAKELLIIVKK